MKSKITLLFSIFILILAIVAFYRFGRSFWHPVYNKIQGSKTVSEVIAQVQQPAKQRFLPYFQKAGVSYPPEQMAFLANKSDRQLSLWAFDGSDWKFIHTYPVKAASGILGPKLREGDRQVPEGIYKIIGLNPNSSYHLSMKLNYPNSFDLHHAKREGRDQPGSNIFIHGKAASIGCLAMGDSAIEELFVMTYKVGKGKVKVIISPDNFSDQLVNNESTNNEYFNKKDRSQPVWLPELYQNIQREIIAITGKNKL